MAVLEDNRYSQLLDELDDARFTWDGPIKLVRPFGHATTRQRTGTLLGRRVEVWVYLAGGRQWSLGAKLEGEHVVSKQTYAEGWRDAFKRATDALKAALASKLHDVVKKGTAGQ